jgi:hypothetical protein
VKLFLQLQDLVLGIRTALFSRGTCVEPVGHGVIWKEGCETGVRPS